MSNATTLSRRKFLGTSAAAGGLVFAFNIPFGQDAAAQTALPSEVNAWVVVKPDD